MFGDMGFDESYKSQPPTALTLNNNRFDIIILSNQGYSTVNYYFKK